MKKSEKDAPDVLRLFVALDMMAKSLQDAETKRRQTAEIHAYMDGKLTFLDRGIRERFRRLDALYEK